MLTYVLSRTIYKLAWIIGHVFTFDGVRLFDELVSVISENITINSVKN